MAKRIYLSPPHMTGEEIKKVKEVFESNWISPAGPHLEEFEKVLSAWSGMPYTAALSSGTAAIHLALLILGIGKGDEVICSSFTFAGSCNPIRYVGATPVFIDSEEITWNIDPNLLEKAILDRRAKGHNPKAIIVVHLYGMPANMERISQIAADYEIPVIEDAAEALGSLYKGKKAGSLGDFGVYSFNGNKIITTSGGGSLQSRNEKWIQKAKFLATQARDVAPHYQHSEVGYNYRLSNVSAAIGLGQMMSLNEKVKQRRANFHHYENVLSPRGVTFQTEPSGSFSNRWLTCMILDPKQKSTPESIRLGLESNNIESRPLWKPMHLQPVYSGCPVYLQGVSDRLFDRGLCLPSGSALEEEELEKILAQLGKLLE
ncbi:MAG: aminotransferase class I/II-fold pyridoxal phosphate-dependent enzyme [Cyclobacteriaceae bacterium]|nr:aminotransferase class I/II-fold pyridoxal phosphate-dependent enzyme [Cyclobacteriaceae bacterium]